ncbi:hypothetical protein V8E55_006917 [Tylopilus felleus]
MYPTSPSRTHSSSRERSPSSRNDGSGTVLAFANASRSLARCALLRVPSFPTLCPSPLRVRAPTKCYTRSGFLTSTSSTARCRFRTYLIIDPKFPSWMRCTVRRTMSGVRARQATQYLAHYDFSEMRWIPFLSMAGHGHLPQFPALPWGLLQTPTLRRRSLTHSRLRRPQVVGLPRLISSACWRESGCSKSGWKKSRCTWETTASGTR